MFDKIYQLFVFGVCVSYITEKLGGANIEWQKTPVEFEKGELKVFGKTFLKIK